MRETGNTGCKGSSYIGINERHFCRLIEILIVHILDEVQHIDINSGEPVHHHIIFFHDFLVVQDICGNRAVSGRNLLLALFIHTAVDGIEKTFCKVCSCAEELHLLTGFCCGYTAADTVVVPPYRTHDIIIFILY